VSGETKATEKPEAADAKSETRAASIAAGKVELIPVTVGAKVGDLVRVDGLAPGTRVVINPPGKLANGAAVVAAKK